MTCIKTGARVHFTDYGQVLPADIFSINDAILIRVAQHYSLEQGLGLYVQVCQATHEVRSNPGGGNEFWRDDLGVFVVPAENLTTIRGAG